MPLLPSLREAVRAGTTPVRARNDLTINNTSADARAGFLQNARRDQLENYAFTGQLRLDATEHYASRASLIADRQAAATVAAAQAQRNVAAGGVERGYRQQMQGVNDAYQPHLAANQQNYAGTLQAAQVLKASG